MVLRPPPSVGTPPPLKKRPGNKGWLAAGLILLFVIVIGAIFAPLTVGPGTRDLPEPPDDSDLQSRAEPIPDEENAYHYFILAVNAMDLSEEDEEQLYELEETDEAYATLLEELIEKNAPAFEYYRKAIAAPRSQAPVLSSYDEDSGIENVYTGDLLNLVYSDIRRRFIRGDELGAMEEALKMAGLGSKLMHSHGIVHFYSEGTYVLYYGLDEFITLVAQSELSPEQLRPFADSFDVLYDDGSGLADAIREDYPLLIGRILEITNVEIPQDEETPEFLRKLGEIAERSAASAYHVNRMRTELVNSLKPLIANADEPLNGMPLDVFDEAENISLTDALSALRPTGLSRFVVLQMLPFLQESIEAKCHANTLVAVAETTLALKLYHLEHGALPATLDELVPDYLDRVPLDDMDGQPIRYDPERKVLYSVGLDFVDSGNSNADPGDSEDDPMWSVDFEANAETTDGEITQE